MFVQFAPCLQIGSLYRFHQLAVVHLMVHGAHHSGDNETGEHRLQFACLVAGKPANREFFFQLVLKQGAQLGRIVRME